MFVNNPTGYIGKSDLIPQKGVSRQGTDDGFLGKATAVRKFL
jgi:ethanolamine ammonia-lyase large subunit